MGKGENVNILDDLVAKILQVKLVKEKKWKDQNKNFLNPTPKPKGVDFKFLIELYLASYKCT